MSTSVATTSMDTHAQTHTKKKKNNDYSQSVSNPFYSSSASSSKEKAREKKKDDAKLKAALNPQHIEQIEGHMKYKWDQETILRVAFSKMASAASGKQYLLLTDLATKLPHNFGVRHLLKFTVFGAWVKRKQWDQFKKLFQLATLQRQQEQPQYEPSPVSESFLWVKLDEWLTAARTLAIETGRTRQQIRTEKEHFLVFDSCEGGIEAGEESNKWLDILGEGLPGSGWYAMQARKELDSSERAAALHRMINVGDCVWGLHGGGVVWLPAIVTAINEHDANAGVSYDLSYFMTHQELQHSRVLASTRQLVVLPSEAATPVLAPKPFQTERQVCDRVFDLINIDKVDSIQAHVLIEALKSKMLEKVVRSSVALSMIVFGTSSSHSSGPCLTTFPLADALLSKFPDGISKAEFIGLGLYALDLHSFNKAITHHQPSTTRKF